MKEEKQEKKRWKKWLIAAIAVVLCLAIIVGVVVYFCTRPPELAEIRARFEELVLASGEINTVFFGTGLPTYERVTDPRETTEIYQKEATGERFYYYQLEDEIYGTVIAYRLYLENLVYVDPDGIKYFYYQIYDETYGKIMVAKTSDGKTEYYLQLLDEPWEGETPDYTDEKGGVFGYLLTDFSYDRNYKDESSFSYVQRTETPMEGKTALYADTEEKIWCYTLSDYEEPVFESYYTDSDPTDYDYVTMDSKYISISQIKEAAELVYSSEYLEAIYDAQFVGAVGADESVSGFSARYMEYTDENGSASLMMSNTYEPFITETRQYLFDTAELVRPSNYKFVTIAVDSYLPSKPDEILRVTVTMVLQDGVWMLDQPTY